MAMEEYALNQEWYIYDEAKHDANSKAPDFPGGLATSGVLVDLDTIAQSLGIFGAASQCDDEYPRQRQSPKPDHSPGRIACQKC